MEIQISRKVIKELDRIPEPLFSQLRKRVEDLANDLYPNGIKRLVNWPGFRLRVGDYRILYGVDTKKKLIIIYRAAHRKDAYRLG